MSEKTRSSTKKWPALTDLYASHRLLADVATIGLILAWYLASIRLPSYILPDPIDVLKMTARLFVDPSLFGHTYISLARVLAAVVIAVILGGGLVVLSHMVPVTNTLVNGRISPFLNAFPTLGWAFMAIFWFGLSTTSVIFVEVAILLPFCIINLASGLRAVDESLLEMGRSFSHSRWLILRKVAMPMVVPYILAAVRVSYGVAWKVALIAELFGAGKGLGYLLEVGRAGFDSTTIFAAIVTIIILVFVMDRLILERLERYTYRYKVQQS